MKIVRPYSVILVFLLFESSFELALAGDIGDDIRGTDASSATKNGGFLEIGLAATLERRSDIRVNPESDEDIQLGVGFSLSAGYRYRRFFIEASESGFDGLNMGFNLFDSDRWSVDLLLANISGNITIESDKPPPPDTESERNQAILERDSLFIAAGTRLTGYFGDNIVQLRLVSDWYGDNGILGSARIGRQWQLGNWNVQAIAGLRYNSAEINNFVYGISSEEQSQRFPQYSADRAWIPEIEFGASLPVRENWVYTTRLRYREYPSSVTNSSLVVNNSDVILSSGIRYVF
jgi:outer membrane protein